MASMRAGTESRMAWFIPPSTRAGTARGGKVKARLRTLVAAGRRLGHARREARATNLDH